MSFIVLWTSFTPLQASRNSWIKLDCLKFCLLWVNWTCCVLLTIIAGSPLYWTWTWTFPVLLEFELELEILLACPLIDNRQTCKLNGKTLEVVLCTEFSPSSDKQGIAGALRQSRIDFTCSFTVFQIALVALRPGPFCKNFKNTREIINT